jgi:DNA-binding transcriptional LysR family regulator
MVKKKALLGHLSDLDIRLLRVFRAVAESGGISAAELELNIGRSTISRHIKDLEIRLGDLTLCRRGRSGFALTDEGQEVYDETLRLLAAMENFRAGINDLHQRITGTLTLALFDKIVTNPASVLHEAIAFFSEKAPEVELRIYVEGINTIERGILDGQYDVGIVPLHRPSATLDYHSMFVEQMFLYCGQGHPLYEHPEWDGSDQEILKHNYVGLGYHSPNMEATHALQLKRRATAYDQEAIAILIRSGCYLAFLPDHYARFFVEQGQIRQIANPRFHYDVQYSAIVRHAPKPSRVVQSFVDCLTQAHHDR